MKPATEALLLAVITAALTGFLVQPRQGPCLPDEVDYWQLAGNIRAGKGLATRISRPLELCIHPEKPFTDISRPPLFPHFVAAQRFLSRDHWVSWNPVGRMAFVLLALAQWVVGYTLGGRVAARLTWALTVPNAWFGFYGSLLLSELLFCLLTTLLIWALLKNTRTRLHALATGFLFAMCFYTRAVAVLYIPGLLFVLWRRPEKRSHAFFVLAAAILPVVPWLFRMWHLTGNPFLAFNSLQLPMFTKTWPGYSLFRTVECLSVLEFVRDNPLELLQKWLHGFVLGAHGIADHTSLGVVALAALTPFFSRSPSPRTLWFVTGLCCLMFLLVLPCYEPRTRHYLPLTVWLVPLAAGSLAALWSSGSPRARALGLLLLFFVLWHHVAERSKTPRVTQLTVEPTAERALRSLPEGIIIASDAPWLVALATPHRSMWLPQDRNAWQACRAALPDLQAVYLTPGLLQWSADQRPTRWEELLRSGGTSDDLGAPVPFPDGSRLWMVERHLQERHWEELPPRLQGTKKKRRVYMGGTLLLAG